MTDKPTLLVDARNALYRAVYAVKADRRPGDKYHCLVIFLRQLASWVRKLQPESVHVFWDAPRATVWRRTVCETYKFRENNPYIMDVGPELTAATTAANDILPWMGIREYLRPGMEADDLIYAAVSVLHPAPTVIVSTDSDMTQIPYTFHTCKVFEPKEQQCLPRPTVNPAIQKALAGDESDNISGYDGIGPVRSMALLECPAKLQAFLEQRGLDTFAKNLLLTDLSLCPRLLANQLYIRKVLAQPITFDRQRILEHSQKHKVHGLMTEYADIVAPMSLLVCQPSS